MFNLIKIFGLICSIIATYTCNAQQLHPFYSNYKVGYANKTGQTIVPAIYDAGSAMVNGFAVVKQNNNCGLIDSTGKLILPIIYQDILQPSEQYIIAKQNGLYGVLDFNNKWLIAAMFTKAFNAKEGKIRVEVQHKFGFINTVDMHLPTKMYENAADYANGLAAVCINNKWGYINAKGKLVLGCIYDYAFAFSQQGSAIVGLHHQDYLINKQCKIIEKIKTKDVEDHENLKPNAAANE